MAKLEKYTMTELVEFYTNVISDDLNVPAKQAKDLFLNALSYSVVKSEILEQARLLL